MEFGARGNLVGDKRYMEVSELQALDMGNSPMSHLQCIDIELLQWSIRARWGLQIFVLKKRLTDPILGKQFTQPFTKHAFILNI